jgi:hypothetical protein
MKLFIASFDATIITMMANSFDDAVIILKEKDSAFYTNKDGTLMYKWDDKYSDFVDLNEVKMGRGIIRWESH